MALHQGLPVPSGKYFHNLVMEYKAFLLLLQIKGQQMLLTNWRS